MLYEKREIIKRYPDNPIVKPSDMPKACAAIYNCGAVKTPEGEYVLCGRFESIDKVQYPWTLRSPDGIHFTPDPEPLKFESDDPELLADFEFYSSKTGSGLNAWYDPRINPLDGTYYLTLSLSGMSGVRIGIAQTDDFKTARPVSFPLHVHNYDAVMFPEKIDGKYWMLHRPSPLFGAVKACIWIASSPDLIHWGNCRIVAQPQGFWEDKKMGVNTPPIRTDQGWLIIHHGVFGHSNGVNYSVGAMLLDLEQPWKVVARTRTMLMVVEELYEMVGQVPNVIYPSGLIAEPDGTFKLYYGAADYCECLATGKIDDLIQACFER